MKISVFLVVGKTLNLFIYYLVKVLFLGRLLAVHE